MDRDVALAEMARTRAVIERKTIRAPFRARVGIADVHPHRFRHTFAHRGQREGMSATSLMAIGGWKDAAMLARYGRSAAAELAVAEYRRVFDAVR